jgi:hypothetical protein
VISINANRGITGPSGLGPDPFLIFARGRLVLRHLQLLSRANAGNGPPPIPLPIGGATTAPTPALVNGINPSTIFHGKLDLGSVGLMGHSRGGEGVRAAYTLYTLGDHGPGEPNWRDLIPGLNVKGIFEIAPTDSVGTINPDGTAWNVLLPIVRWRR